MTDLASIALVAGAALGGGFANAIAGGGSLLTFPVLVALGIPPVDASVTNTIALCPGYFGATLAQRRDLVGQRARMLRILPAGVLGGIAGALLLLATDDRAFDRVVPFLILGAAVLLAVQDRIRGWLVARRPTASHEAWAAVPVGLAAIYGGYFGAGMGVIILASLGILIVDNLTRLNALKQTVSLAVNVAAATVFALHGRERVHWDVVAIMLVGALAGGILGGLVASRVPAALLRAIVVIVALAVGIAYLVRG